MSNLVAKVKRETIEDCITCPLCSKLFRDATTISECLHTFCRKCIHDKISNEELDCCPVCNIDLGCVPLEKLRPDHNLEVLRAKIFPSKRKKVNTPEAAPSATLPTRRKERSLSSLVVSTPKVSSQGATIGNREKTATRKAAALRGSSSVIDKVPKKVEYSEEHSESSSSPETLKKFTKNKRQGSSSANHRDFVGPKVEDEDDSSEVKLDLWKPLNCLVEVANRSNSFKSNSQGTRMKLESFNLPDTKGRVRKTKTKENKHNANAEEEKNNALCVSSEAVECKKLRRIRQRRAVAHGDPGISSQAVLDAVASSRQGKRSGPVWFSLVASEDQKGDSPLPQIPASYLRIKDGNMPVSVIQKYLMKKLVLAGETEVEIKCMGQTVVPSLQLHNLIDLWLEAASTPVRSSATIGSSAKDLIMLLTYARKDPGSQ